MDSKGINMALTTIRDILKREGFARLPRRDKDTKNSISILNADIIMADKTCLLSFAEESFSTEHAGLLCLLPFISYYGIDKAIETSDYPETSQISRVCAILNFLALKLSRIERYTTDDLWCMDRGLGLFSGSNILPKAAWFSSYSSGTTRAMNLSFLKKLHCIWRDNGFIGDTVNIDFTAIPYWGDGDNLENNWSGKRNKSLASMLAVLAQDPDTGIICYGDSTVRHDNQSDYKPFVRYYLGILQKAYNEFEERVEYLSQKGLLKPDRIKAFIDSKVGKISKKEILEACPDISKVTVERTLTILVKSGYLVKISGGRTTAYAKAASPD
jgi:hypothetical protein